MAHRGAAADGAAGPRWKPAHRMGWRPALAQVRRLDSYRARGGEARQGPRHAVPGRRQAGGGFCAARPGADALAPRAEVGFRSGGDFQSRPALRRDVMQTGLADFIRDTPEGAEADAILRKCVHCGFCTATCPTYQLLGDDLDSPRGRIYLMKQVLEGHTPTRKTQLHLDRCLTCRNCETTCPSGVQYGNLVEIGRRIVDERVERPADERALRGVLKEGLTSPLFSPAMKLGQLLRPWLPSALKNKVPASASAEAHRWPTRTHPRKVLLLMGCVQPAMMPNINSATARVLDAAGIQTVVADEAGCCGAIRLHLSDHEGGLADMRRNIDAWWPSVSAGQVEAIVMNASGCGVTVKEYGHSLARDPVYADKARRISELTKDLSELLPQIVPALKQRLALPRSAGERGEGATDSSARRM